MCLLVIAHRLLEDAPLAVAANREEYFQRPTLDPAIHQAALPCLCGTDARAGGTWLGVNACGLVVGVTNRPKGNIPEDPRSRGTLCRELLERTTAAEAAEHAWRSLAHGPYAGANFLCADSVSAHIVHAGDNLERQDLPPGWHLLTAGNIDDPHDARLVRARREFEAAQPNTAESFLAAARRILALGKDDDQPPIVLRHENRGTVSSTLITLTAEPALASYAYAPGAPDETAYRDYSAELQRLLANGC